MPIVRGLGDSSGHHCISGIYNIEHYVMALLGVTVCLVSIILSTM